MGGESSERTVSLESGTTVCENIPKQKYNVTTYNPAKDLQKLVDDAYSEKIDVIFPVLHGKLGEDGTIQGLLELLHIPYVGSGVLASALCMDKIKTKEIVAAHGIKTPAWNVFSEAEAINYANNIFPCVVKPVSSGSSIGISIPQDRTSLTQAVKKAFLEGDKIYVEEYIKGDEYTVSVIGPENKPKALPVIQIIPKKNVFYDPASKYDKGGSTYICPAEIPDTLREELYETAKKIYQIIGCDGMARVDYMVDCEGTAYFLEINTLPGMTSTSLLPKAVKAAKIEFPSFLDNLIQWALK